MLGYMGIEVMSRWLVDNVSMMECGRRFNSMDKV